MFNQPLAHDSEQKIGSHSQSDALHSRIGPENDLR